MPLFGDYSNRRSDSLGGVTPAPVARPDDVAELEVSVLGPRKEPAQTHKLAAREGLHAPHA